MMWRRAKRTVESGPLPVDGATGAQRQRSRPSLRGKVVVVDFWAYSCINCLRVPYVNLIAITRTGMVILGVHSPSSRSKDIANVREAKKFDISTSLSTTRWRSGSSNNKFWPAHYFVDAKGRSAAIISAGKMRQSRNARSDGCSPRLVRKIFLTRSTMPRVLASLRRRTPQTWRHRRLTSATRVRKTASRRGFRSRCKKTTPSESLAQPVGAGWPWQVARGTRASALHRGASPSVQGGITSCWVRRHRVNRCAFASPSAARRQGDAGMA